MTTLATMEGLEWEDDFLNADITDDFIDCLLDTDTNSNVKSSQNGEVAAVTTTVKPERPTPSASDTLIPMSSWVSSTTNLNTWQQKQAKKESIKELNAGLTQDARLHLCCLFYNQKSREEKPILEEMVFLKPRFLAWCKNKKTLLVEGSNVIRTILPEKGVSRAVTDENITEDIVAAFNHVITRWEMFKQGKPCDSVGLISLNWTFLVPLVFVACPRIYRRLPNILERSRKFNQEHFKKKAGMVHDNEYPENINLKLNPHLKETPLWIEFSFRDPHNAVHNPDPQNLENRNLFIVHRDERYAPDDSQGLLVVDNTDSDTPFVVIGDPVELIKIIVEYCQLACLSCVEFNGATGTVPVFTIRYGTYDHGTGIPSNLGESKLSLNDPFLKDVDKTCTSTSDPLYDKLVVLGDRLVKRFEFDFKSLRQLWVPENIIRQRILNNSKSCISSHPGYT